MDVQPGHCWRCERVLPQHPVPCRLCTMAKYCKKSCRDRDKVRHGCVECVIYGNKTCAACGKKAPNVSECAGCNNAWYCNKECQLSHWPAHKESCNHVKRTIKMLSAKLAVSNTKLACNAWFAGPPYYIGNTVAEDFLNLANNELSDDERAAEQLTRDFYVLSAGCGDLRNTVMTAASLPDEYQGKLYITLDDFDPFVMARNVLFLFMLVRFADADYIAPSLTTIWYSLHLSKKEYDLIKTSLEELIPMSAQQLHDATKGLVTLLDQDLRYLCQVWEGWQSLECLKENRSSINLKTQRNALFEAHDVTTGVRLYINHLPKENRQFMKEWFDHALFVPTQSPKKTELPYNNPTLTGRESKTSASPDITPPEDVPFVYCIDEATHPYMAWDCLRIREHIPGPHSCPMVMYHKYVTNLLKKVKSLILQGRLLIHVSLANCLDFPNHHEIFGMPNYDRIFTSNLADYDGVAKLLQTFKPLLNATNSYSTIVTHTLNWIEFVPGANIESFQFTGMFERCKDLRILDIGSYTDGFNTVREYYNNTPHFLWYLRADIMAGGLGIPSLKEVPSFESVKKYHGLQMRDFRKGQNKLVPFQYRLNARPLNMMNGYNRSVEWFLPQGSA